MRCTIEKCFVHISFVVLCSLIVFVSLERDFHEEFCQWETFNVSCPQDEFILITSARYGRMKVGRCIPVDYYTGCSVDVQLQLEGRCSGRRQCTVAISDSQIFRVQPCRKDLVPYLDAAYRCVKVSGADETSASSTCDGVIPVRNTSGYLASHVTLNTGFGSERCPWLLEARPGQHIAVTLKDFSQRTDKTDPGGAASAAAAVGGAQSWAHAAVGGAQSWAHAAAPGIDCLRVAEVRESLVSSGAHYLQLCPGNNRRSSTYTSAGNSLQLNFVDSEVANNRFFIQYEVIGCPDVTAPRNAWLTRNGDTLLVICNYTSERWYIACSGRDWVSPLANCSAASFTGVYLDNEQTVRHTGSFPFGLLMAVAAGAIIGISIGFGCLLVICVGRKRWKERRHVQNVENSNRENVYKLIDLWAKPEIHCDCAVLQPEVTCDCMLPDVRLSRRRGEEGGMEAFIGYVSSTDRIRHENSGSFKQRMGHGGHGTMTNCSRGGSSWDPDRGDTRDEAPGLEEDPAAGAAAGVFGSGRTLQQRCTCSSGKCRHHQTPTIVDGSSSREEAVESGGGEVMHEQEEEVDVEGDPAAAVPPRSTFPSPDSKTPAAATAVELPAFTGQRTTK